MIISGLDELVAGLLREAASAEENGRKASAETARRVEAKARSLAPKRTGTLARSISTDETSHGVEVGPTVRYAPFVEYGTWKDAPQPFMGPAAEGAEDDLAGELSKRVGEL